MVSGSVGVLFEVGSTTVKLMKSRFEFNQLVDQHPLGFIIDTNKELTDLIN